MAEQYVQIPPDSTGKRIRHDPYHSIDYNARIGNHIWQTEKIYQITGSITADVFLFQGEDADAGTISVRFTDRNLNGGLQLTAGDKINYLGAEVATVVSEELVFVPYINIAGGKRPENTVDVDKTGSMNMRFAEGLPQVDAFGRLRTSAGTSLGEYIFSYDILPFDFSTKIVGNASAVHEPNLRALKLVCPSGAPAAGSVDAAGNTDLVSHTTNTYHHYFPGFSQTAMMTVALGDTGKDGVKRDWGYFDVDNGYLFRCDNTTDGLKCVIKSSASGQLKETIISKTKTEIFVDGVLQSTVSQGFNGDPVDGTGNSQMNLSLTDDNIYWLDVQWLGAGRVRFGTYYEGERIIIHQYYHNNNAGQPTSQTGSLPICYSQINTASQVSESIMLAWCASAQTEHDVTINQLGRNRLETITKTFNTTAVENGQPYEFIGVLSPAKQITENGNANRTLYLPNYMEAMAYHADGSEAFVEVEVYVNPIIGGGNKSFPINNDEINDASLPWLQRIEPGATVESYKPANFVLADRPLYWGGGLHVLATYMKGYNRSDLTDAFANFQDGAFKNFSENGGHVHTYVGSITPSPDGTTPTVVTVDTAIHPMLALREGYPQKINGIVGTVGTDIANGLNYSAGRDNQYYIRVISTTQFELYEDIEFTTPVITQGLTYTSGGKLHGDYGDQINFAIVCKPLAPTIAKQATSGDVTVHFNLGWSEVNQ